MIRLKFHQALCLLALLPSSAFAWEKDKPATPPLIPPNPNNLPKVLLIGDSISSSYLQPVAKALEGKAVVAKSSDNGESTAVGVLKIDGWLGDTKWDVIHFNWGVWDMYGWQYAEDDRSPAAYAQRLETLVVRMKKTGAKLIWATTTPVPPKAESTMLKRWKKEVVISPDLECQYRDAALQVMKKHEVQVNDLYSVLKPRQSELQAEDNVHFSQAAAYLMAKQVADCIQKNLGDATEGRFIDAHVHFHDRNPGDLDKVAEWMKANNVQRIINHPLMQSRARDDKERSQQTENYKAFKGSMARFCIVYYDEVNSVDEAVAILNREKQAGAVGFGEHYGSAANPKSAEVVNGKPVYKSLFIDDPKSMVLFAACEKVGLPVMFHMDRSCNLDEKGFPHLENVLKTYPKCTFIAHSDWWRSITEGACGRLLETHPNLYADISCTVGRSPIGRDKPMAREFFIRHADKLLFGTDSGWWSLGKDKKQAGEFALIDELKLPKEVEDKICRRNAQRLFWGKKPENSSTK